LTIFIGVVGYLRPSRWNTGEHQNRPRSVRATVLSNRSS